MMFRRKNKLTTASTVPDSIASRYLHNRIAGLQAWLNQQTPLRRKGLFITAGVLFGTYCGVLVFAPALVQTDIATEHIAIPQLPAPPAANGNITDSSVFDPSLQHLVDSIQRDTQGRQMLDSLEATLRVHKPW